MAVHRRDDHRAVLVEELLPRFLLVTFDRDFDAAAGDAASGSTATASISSSAPSRASPEMAMVVLAGRFLSSWGAAPVGNAQTERWGAAPVGNAQTLLSGESVPDPRTRGRWAISSERSALETFAYLAEQFFGTPSYSTHSANCAT